MSYFGFLSDDLLHWYSHVANDAWGFGMITGVKIYLGFFIGYWIILLLFSLLSRFEAVLPAEVGTFIAYCEGAIYCPRVHDPTPLSSRTACRTTAPRNLNSFSCHPC